MRLSWVKILWLLIALLMTSFTFQPPGSLAREYLDIYSTGIIKFPVAVADFEYLDSDRDPSGMARKITDILSNDLKISGIFDVRTPGLNADFFKDEKFGSHETINYSQWISLLKVDGLVKGGYRYKRDPQTKSTLLSIEVYFYDLTIKSPILGKRYEAGVEDARRMVHRIGNDIVYELTGERGIFDTKIAFSSKQGKYEHLFVIDFDGANLRRITRGQFIDFSPTWSPDGKYLAFTSISPADSRINLYAQSLSDGRRKLISDFPGLNTAAAWSADGRKLAFVLSKDGNPEIYVKDRNGTLIRLTKSWSIDTEPTWSPDGKWIAFVSDQAGSPQIYIMDEKGGNVRRLTYEGNYNTSPAWSPRGDKIVYNSFINNGDINLCLINPDGRGNRFMTKGVGRNESPSWSPDGRLIAFSSTRLGSSQILIMEANGSNVRRLTMSKGEFADPAWSPRLGQ